MALKDEALHSSDLPPMEIFCSYAHTDEALRQELEQHLSLLTRQGIALLWHDRHIAPGKEWSQAIDTHLETASVFLLLISSAFLASDYCYGVEMQRALQRHEAHEALVLSILLRPCDWPDAPFASLQMLPTDAKPVTSTFCWPISVFHRCLARAVFNKPAPMGHQPIWLLNNSKGKSAEKAINML